MNTNQTLQWHACPLVEKTKMGATYILVKLKPAVNFRFTSGQYVKMCVAGQESAAMYLSIASSPQDKITLDFCLLAEGKHPVLMALRSAKTGQEFMVSDPMGSFVIVDHHRPMQFIAGGSGIAPIRSFLRDFSPTVVTQPVRLIYGCRNETAMPYLSELQSMADRYKQFELILVAEKSLSPRLTSGSVLDALRKLDNFKFFDHYLCGSRNMVQAVREHLLANDVSEHSIYFDK